MKFRTFLKRGAVSGLLALSVAQTAQAGIIGSELDGQIDFRTSDYAVCSGVSPCTVGNLTIEASNGMGAADIFWGAMDGLGVLGGQEDDEIDGSNQEQLKLTFAMPQTVLGVWFTDLFNLGADPVETASVRLTTEAGGFLDFLIDGIDPNGSSNGEVYLDFGGAISVTEILFGSDIDIDDDHSVAGLVTGMSVPEPGIAALLLFGLIGLRLRDRAQAAV